MNQDAHQDADVVIIGGGIAGLTCAVGLVDRGLGVVVLEKDKRLGGRASSWNDPTTGDAVHIGPHIFLDEYPNFFALLDRCKTRDRVVWNQDRAFITTVDGEREIAIERSLLPPPYHFAPSLLRDPTLSIGDVVSNWPVVALALQADEAAVRRFDAMDAKAFLLQAGVTPNFIERFWAFTALAILNVPIERCSAGALVRFYRFLLGHADVKVGFADRGLGDVYAPACREIIENAGSSVRLNTSVDQILVDASRSACGVVLADGSRITARHVIAALPPTALRSLVRTEWSELAPFRALDRFHPVAYAAPYLWFDRKLTHKQFWARVYKEGDYNCDFYDLSNINRGWKKRPSIITSNVIGSERLHDASDETILEKTREELAEYLPASRDAKLVHAVVHRIPMAIHAPEPGTESLRPSTRTPVERLLLAGDWIDTGFPSSMESAAAAGWLAAEAVLADNGVVCTLRQPARAAPDFVNFLAANAHLVPFKRPPRHLSALLRSPNGDDEAARASEAP